MNIDLKILGSGVLFVLSIAAGIWLSSRGKPYNTGIFTVHKLLALAAVVFSVLMYISLLQNVEKTAILVLLLGIAGISVLALFVSGALLSTGTLPYGLLKTVHSLAPVVAVVSLAVSVFMLLGRK